MNSSQKVFTKMYEQAGANAQQGPGAGYQDPGAGYQQNGNNNQGSNNGPDSDVVDGDYTEI